MWADYYDSWQDFVRGKLGDRVKDRTIDMGPMTQEELKRRMKLQSTDHPIPQLLEALALLRRLVENTTPRYNRGRVECVACGCGWLIHAKEPSHSSSCPWLAAKRVVESL